MKISAEERLMYDVMKALYDSGIPISFKGSMVLKACLMEAGFSDDTRHTVDIDGNCMSILRHQAIRWWTLSRMCSIRMIFRWM